MEYLCGFADLDVAGARDGVDALHQVLTRHYDVVILDMMMPKMSGTDFLDSLQAMVEDPSLNYPGEPPAIIVVTAASADEIPSDRIEQRYAKLVRRMFRKPVDFRSLSSVVRDSLGAPEEKSSL